jgi:hypothetical protein
MVVVAKAYLVGSNWNPTIQARSKQNCTANYN